MSLLLGLIVAASFGSGDFLGGLASRHVPDRRGAVSRTDLRTVGAVVVATIAGGSPGPADFVLGGLAGSLNVAALGCLYQGLGVVANQPQSLAGTLDIPPSQKGASFVTWCDSFGLPLLTLVDTPGYFPGKDLEWRGSSAKAHSWLRLRRGDVPGSV